MDGPTLTDPQGGRMYATPLEGQDRVMELRIIIFKQEDLFIAQCLDHDVAVQGSDMATVQRRFEETVFAEGEGLTALPAAPEAYHVMWAGALELESNVDNAEMRLAA